MSDTFDLKKLSDRKLADLFGGAKKQAKAEAKRLEAITKELVRRGKTVYRGVDFEVLKVVGEQNRFDSAAVKIEMGDAWYDARKKVVSTTEWAVSPKAAAPTTDAV